MVRPGGGAAASATCKPLGAVLWEPQEEPLVYFQVLLWVLLGFTYVKSRCSVQSPRGTRVFEGPSQRKLINATLAFPPLP